MNFVAETEVFKFPDRAARNRVLVERLRRGGRSSDRGQRGRRDGSAAGTRLEVLRQGRPPGNGSYFLLHADAQVICLLFCQNENVSGQRKKDC